MTHWQTIPPLTERQRFVDTLGLHPLTAQVLINRGIATPEEALAFLQPRLAQLHDPFCLPDMRGAVERIARAIEGNERICLFGDYDTDGVTGTAVAVLFFRAIGVEVDWAVPHRTRDGYGLTVAALERLRGENTPHLIITIDNGTTAMEAIAAARTTGIDIIVTDHHEVATSLPPAIAIVNPKRTDGPIPYPFPGLCGAGVMFKLCIALRSYLRERGYFRDRPEPNLAQWLDLVAIGTIADIVPLRDENRIFCAIGLKAIGKTANIGLQALCRVAGVDPFACNARAVAYQLAPRLNAAGRLDDAALAVELLTTAAPERACQLAERLQALNTERQRQEETITNAMEVILGAETNDDWSIVAASPQWAPGIVGIVAGRLAAQHRKPTVLISTQGAVGIGSARGVGDFPLIEALAACAPYLHRYGGHTKAAGVTIARDQVAAFRAAFEAAVRERMRPEYRTPTIQIDGELTPKEITPQLVEEIARLAPFGEGNPEPVLCLRNLEVRQRRIVGGRHLKLSVHGETITFDAIGFSMHDHPESCTPQLDVACTPETNEWNGMRTIQLKLRDIRAILRD